MYIRLWGSSTPLHAYKENQNQSWNEEVMVILKCIEDGKDGGLLGVL